MNDYPDRQGFAELIGSRFTIPIEEGGELALTLVEVNALGSREEGGRTVESFSLIFEGPPDLLLPQGTYSFSHAQLAELVIFVVPIGPRGDVLGYEAIFN